MLPVRIEQQNRAKHSVRLRFHQPHQARQRFRQRDAGGDHFQDVTLADAQRFRFFAGGDVFKKTFVKQNAAVGVMNGPRGFGNPDRAAVFAINLVFESGHHAVLSHEPLEFLAAFRLDVTLDADVRAFAHQFFR